MKETVGLIGVGIMGKLMVDRMLEHGYKLVVYDPDPAAQEFCRVRNVTVAKDNAALAGKAQKIIVSVANPKISIAIAKELAPVVGPGHIVLETSTVTPDISFAIAEIYQGTGAVFVESSILGKPIACGQWVMPAGGDASAIKAMEPILLSFASRVIRAGDIGASNTIKVLNNTMYSVINACICEVMAIADNAGVDKKAFYDIVANSAAATNCGLFREVGLRIAEGRFDQPDATNELIRKDNTCGVAFAKSVGISPLIAGVVLMQYDNAVECGYAKEDNAIMYRYFKQIYAPKP